MSTIHVLGSINMDIIVQVEELPRTGETIHGKTVFITPGGKGANQALAAARAGATVRLCTAVGSDEHGKMLLDGLSPYINTDFCSQKHGQSGTAYITVDSHALNTIVVVAGANDLLSIQDVAHFSKGINGEDFCIGQLEVPSNITRSFFQAARKVQATTILNPSPITRLDETLLEVTDILILNETEARTITNQPSVSTERLADLLHARGISIVVITRGENGAVYSGAHGARHPGYRVNAIDSTAAGDAFLGALATSLAEGKSPTDSLAFANAAGALCTMKPGAQPAIPSRKEILDFMKANG